MIASRGRVTAVWFGLVALTCATTWGLTTRGIPSALAVTGIFVTTAVKVTLVMWEFMGLRHAPWQVRGLFAAWVAGVTAMILTFWFLTPDMT